MKFLAFKSTFYYKISKVTRNIALIYIFVRAYSVLLIIMFFFIIYKKTYNYPVKSSF